MSQLPKAGDPVGSSGQITPARPMPRGSGAAVGRRSSAALPYRAWLLALLVVALVATGVAPFNRQDWILEHLLTVAALLLLVLYERRRGAPALGDAACTGLFVFLLLHVLGAWYLYSRVPYAVWYERLLGAAWPGDTTRNHYDRFVHFAFGVLVLPAAVELVRRHVTAARGFAIAVAIALMATLSKLYELAEWGLAITLSPEAAEAYNGQQGDMFDAQKDMALALAGSLVSATYVALRWRRVAPVGTPPRAPPR